jgi:UDP-N-acetylmuramoyl-tripeptide--D-alanyl-D-alanine ligase
VVSRFFGLQDSEISRGIATFKTAYGRTEIYSIPEKSEVIGDYYNSNPTSLAAALKLLHDKKGASQYHAVLGDMLELGEEEERFHREVVQPIREFGITHVWLFGPRMKSLFDELQAHSAKPSVLEHVAHFERIEDLSAALKSQIKPGARVLVKGSRGMKMERVLDVLIPGRKPS